MKTIAAVLVAIIASSACAQEKKDEPTGVLLIRESSTTVAKDFADDSRGAEKKYTPVKARKGKAEGTVVKIYGKITKANGVIQLENWNGWTVALKGEIAGAGQYAEIDVVKVAVMPLLKQVTFDGAIKRTDTEPKK
jgi:hypothetical protein